MEVVRFRQNGNIANCEGLLHLDGDRLRIEYQLVDGVMGVVKSDVKEVSIALADLASVQLVPGWFGGSKIVLQAKSMEAVKAAPGMSRGRVELGISREDREAAQRLVGGLSKPDGTNANGLDY